MKKKVWMSKEQFDESIIKSLHMILPKLILINKHQQDKLEKIKKAKYYGKQISKKNDRRLDNNLKTLKDHLELGF